MMMSATNNYLAPEGETDLLLHELHLTSQNQGGKSIRFSGTLTQQRTPRNIPEKPTSQLHLGGSLGFRERHETLHCHFFFFWRDSPPVGHGLLIHEVSRSHTTTHYSR